MERDKLIAVLQVFGILLVVLGHCQSGVEPKPLWFDWIYTFHMPLFIFISGYLLKYTSELKSQPMALTSWWGSKGWIWKKTKRLLVPYFVISTLAFLPKGLMSQFALRPIDMSLGSYLEMLIYPVQNVIGFFWFQPTLFLIFGMVMCAARCAGTKVDGRVHYALLGAALLLLLYNPLLEMNGYIFSIFNMSGAVTYLFYFALGYYARRWRWAQLGASHAVALAGLTFGLSVAMVTVIPDFVGKSPLAAVNGIVMSVQICKIYVRCDWRFLDHLMGAPYAIFIFSWFPQTASQQIFVSLTHSPRWVGGVLAFFSGIYVPWLVYKWIRAHKEGRVGKVVAFLSGM